MVQLGIFERGCVRRVGYIDEYSLIISSWNTINHDSMKLHEVINMGLDD